MFERVRIGIRTVSWKIIGNTHRVRFRQQDRLEADAHAKKHTKMQYALHDSDCSGPPVSCSGPRVRCSGRMRSASSGPLIPLGAQGRGRESRGWGMWQSDFASLGNAPGGEMTRIGVSRAFSPKTRKQEIHKIHINPVYFNKIK